MNLFVYLWFQFSSVQSLSCIWLFVNPWTAACQASIPIANSQSLLKLMSIELVVPSNHLILCRPLLLQSFPASGSSLMGQLFASSGQSMHNIKLTILTICKRSAQWQHVPSRCCASITPSISLTLFIWQNRSSITFWISSRCFLLLATQSSNQDTWDWARCVYFLEGLAVCIRSLGGRSAWRGSMGGEEGWAGAPVPWPLGDTTRV